MITNALTINSAGRSSAERIAESRVRSAQRRLNINPVQMTFEENSNSSPVKDKTIQEEISLYAGNSPQGSPRPCSISPCLEIGLLSPLRESEVIEERHDIDFNSVDSGYQGTQGTGRKLFTFVEPNGLAPRASPPKTSNKTSPTSVSCFRTFNSLSSDSAESMDDECMDLLDMETLDDNAQLPTAFNSIINGNIRAIEETTRRPLLHRCLSLSDSNVIRGKKQPYVIKTPELLKSIAESASPFAHSKTFKRPEPPSSTSPVHSKRYKINSTDDKENANELMVARPVLRKSLSMNDEIIMSALARCKFDRETHLEAHDGGSLISHDDANVNVFNAIRFHFSIHIASCDPDLIGDFSKQFCLPSIEGRHTDLRSITVHTMANLLRGDHKDAVASFRIIDCRYPYEFEGGHIRGAENMYTHEQILNHLVNTKTEAPKVVPDGPKRNIIVFHCEFSSERGPKL